MTSTTTMFPVSPQELADLYVATVGFVGSLRDAGASPERIARVQALADRLTGAATKIAPAALDDDWPEIGSMDRVAAWDYAPIPA